MKTLHIWRYFCGCWSILLNPQSRLYKRWSEWVSSEFYIQAFRPCSPMLVSTAREIARPTTLFLATALNECCVSTRLDLLLCYQRDSNLVISNIHWLNCTGSFRKTKTKVCVAAPRSQLYRRSSCEYFGVFHTFRSTESLLVISFARIILGERADKKIYFLALLAFSGVVLLTVNEKEDVDLVRVHESYFFVLLVFMCITAWAKSHTARLS